MNEWYLIEAKVFYHIYSALANPSRFSSDFLKHFRKFFFIFLISHLRLISPLYAPQTKFGNEKTQRMSYFICKWIVHQSSSIVQILVVSYHLVVSYPQQCHNGINVSQINVSIHITLFFAVSRAELWIIFINY